MDNKEVLNQESCEGGDCGSCGGGCGPAIQKQSGKLFAVFSGKGGTGKSVITALLASKLTKLGFKIGVLDADIAGPTIHLLFGKTELADSDKELVYPMVSDGGVRLISMGNVQEKAEAPMIWSGKDLAAGAQYFYTDVKWEYPDAIFIDMPTGIGDIPLNLYTTLPFSGSLCVVTPNDLSVYVAKKSIELCRMLMVPVLGVVQNMTHVDCPSCDYGVRLGLEPDKLGEALGVPTVAAVPYMQDLSVMADMGRIEDAQAPQLDKLADALADIIKSPEKKPGEAYELNLDKEPIKA